MSYSSKRIQSARAASISMPILPAAIMSAVFGLGIAITALSLTSPAAAYDDDVDVVCWDREDGETECQSIAELTAECALVDPEYTTEQCSDLLENRVPVGIGLKTKEKTKDKTKRQRDDNGGKDRNPNGGGNSGGGNSGGGSSGGGSGAGGSGPNG